MPGDLLRPASGRQSNHFAGRRVITRELPGSHDSLTRVTTFSRIAVVNRGEAAMRLIHAVRDLNAATRQTGGHQIEVIALHTEGEKRAMFVREADVAYDLGPAANRPYLDHALLERALTQTRADAAWVGWGFVAEDAAFADLCARIGVAFIGPSGEAMRKLGDKIGSKLIAEEVGVPVAPWSKGGVDTLGDALAVANDLGYPLMLKATAGGGGRGIRKVTSDDELTAAYQLTRDEAQRAFGSGVVFLESLVTGARHVEVQVIADDAGTILHLGERECSLQRRHQKVIEEAPSPVVSAALRERLGAAAVAAARAAGYRNAGTVEFLLHGEDDAASFYFLEMNTRLQVEHAITEAVTGIDLVHLQLDVAEGRPLPTTTAGVVPRGHAFECRVYAEDPDAGFLPQAGRILCYREPRGPGVRVDSGIREGDVVTPDFDPLLAKLVTHAPTRDLALARMRTAVRSTVVLGLRTNLPWLGRVLAHPDVAAGSMHTDWIGTHQDALAPPPSPRLAGLVEAIAATQTRSGGRASSADTPRGDAGTSPWDTLGGWRA